MVMTMITQKDIAEKLGISRTTVARAINGSGAIKEETKNKILELAKELNYEKNYLGSVLAGKKEKNVYALIVKSKNEFYTQEIKKGLEWIERENRAYGFKINIILTDINDIYEQKKKLEEILRTKEIDGLIITPLDREKIYVILEPYLEKIKIVSLGIRLDKNIDHIGPDHIKQGKIAGELMINCLRDNEKLLVIDNGDDKVSSKYYLQGFLEKVGGKDIELHLKKGEGIEKSKELIIDYCTTREINGIYINRYAHDILNEIPKEYLINKYIITNGMGKIIKKLVKEKIIRFTVMEEIREEGYLAGKRMFEILYKNLIEEPKWQKSKSQVITYEQI